MKLRKWLRAATDLFGSTEQLRRLNPEEDPAAVKKKRIRKYAMLMAFTALTGILAGAAYRRTVRNVILTDGLIERTAAGSESREYTLVASSDDHGERRMDVTVSSQRLYGEEEEAYFEKAYEWLEREMLAGNTSADMVTGPLKLVKRIGGTEITVEWETPDPHYLYSDGSIRTGRITGPTPVVMTAVLHYFDDVRIRQIPICLMPEETDADDMAFTELEQRLREQDMDQSIEGYMALPSEMGESAVTWSEPEDRTASMLVCLGLAASLVLIPAGQQELRMSERKRQDQMLKDYPDIVSNFIMLTGAGMTCRGAWERIVSDYSADRRAGRSEIRFAYEEMKYAVRELNIGKSEKEVYEDFGSRCGSLQYQRFGTLLAGNLKRGSRELNRLLELEAADAFSTRRESVRRKAEELGTKLLLPMLIMMCIVIAVIIVPAFRTFSF